jgi:predicted deacylase
MISEHNWTQSDLGSSIALYASHPLAELAGQRPILLMGGVHGDEPEGVELAQKTLAFLESDAKKAQPEVTVPWILIPILNVDGFRRRTRVNGRGVDLNRNYPSKSWTPVADKERYNPGPSPASEAEVRAVVGLIETCPPRLLIHCHSWNPCIVCAGKPGWKDAERLAQASGYELREEIGYPTPGSLSQYGWVDRKIPVICIEEQEGAPLDEVWPRFAGAMRGIFLDASPR